jgi:hypothetical protein
VFEAYATLEHPGSGDHDEPSEPEGQDRHDASVIAILSNHTAGQPWWLGYLETGASDIVFNDVRKAGLPGRWRYVLVEAGPEQAATWRREGWAWKGVLPDLIFPTDRSWLFSTLWDDDWTCIGGPRELVDAFLNDPDLQHHAREVKSLVEDATPPGHTAI